MERSKARTLTIGTGILLGLGEIAQTFIIETPAPAAIFAFLFLGAAWLVRQDRLSGVITIGILALMELVAIPSYERKTTSDWIWEIAIGVVSAVALISAARVLIQRRRGGKPA